MSKIQQETTDKIIERYCGLCSQYRIIPGDKNFKESLTNIINSEINNFVKEILSSGYDKMSGTYSPDAIFEYLQSLENNLDE